MHISETPSAVVSLSLTKLEELRLKAPRPVVTPEEPPSCLPELIGLLWAVDPYLSRSSLHLGTRVLTAR